VTWEAGLLVAGAAKGRLGALRVPRLDEAKFSMGSVKRVPHFMSGHM
jgi:hypothetical protein